MKLIYDNRTERIRKYFQQRLVFVQKEHLIFDVLIKYFKYYRQIKVFLESPQGEQLIRYNGGEKLGNHYDSKSILDDLSKKWSRFYTSISDGEIDLNDNLFESFKKQYEQKMAILTDAVNKCILENSNLGNISDTSSIERTPTPSNSIEVDRECIKSIKGFSGSKPLSFD